VTLFVASFFAGPGLGALEHFALIDPNLDADLAVGRIRLGETVVDVGAQRLEGNGALVIVLAAGDVGAGQTAADLNLDALRGDGVGAAARLHRVAHRHLDGAAERNAALELGSDVLGDELGVRGDVVHLDDVDVDRLADHFLELSLQLADLAAALADDHAGLRAVDGHAHAGLI